METHLRRVCSYLMQIDEWYKVHVHFVCFCLFFVQFVEIGNFIMSATGIMDWLGGIVVFPGRGGGNEMFVPISISYHDFFFFFFWGGDLKFWSVYMHS